MEGLTVGLVGDIAHSRVARSNIHGLLKLGAHVIVCGPPTLVPPSISKLGVEVSYQPGRYPAALRRRQHAADSVRAAAQRTVPVDSRIRPPVRHESANGCGWPSPIFCCLAPGPINRGVEITPDVADGPHSAILQQVTNGLAVRMAILSLLFRSTRARSAPASSL